MRTSTIDRRTRSLHRRWTTVAALAALVAAAVSSLSGGPDAWARLLVGTVSVVAIAAACREQLSLRVGLGLGLVNAAIVPIEIGADRTVIAAVAGLALLVAAESVVVAQRLLTSAPVVSTRVEAVALLARTAMATGAVLIVVTIAQIGRLGTVAAVLGVVVAVVALAALSTSGGATDDGGAETPVRP